MKEIVVFMCYKTRQMNSTGVTSYDLNLAITVLTDVYAHALHIAVVMCVSVCSKASL